MARKVGVNEFAHRGYRGRLINWEKWCTGDNWVLEQGVDFQGERVDSTRSAGAQWATRNGMKASTEIVGPREFTFQIIEGLSDDMARAARRIHELEETGASDGEVQTAIREARRVLRGEPPTPPMVDPVEARRERLSDANPREFVKTTRPMSRRRRV